MLYAPDFKWYCSNFLVTSSSLFSSLTFIPFIKYDAYALPSSSHAPFKNILAHVVWWLPPFAVFFESLGFYRIHIKALKFLCTWVQQFSSSSGFCLRRRGSICSNSVIYSMEIEAMPYLDMKTLANGNYRRFWWVSAFKLSGPVESSSIPQTFKAPSFFVSVKASPIWKRQMLLHPLCVFYL